MKKGVVIPCSNVEVDIDLLKFKKFITSHPNYTLCFVNKGNNDRILELLKSFQRQLLNTHNGLGTQFLIHNMPSDEKSSCAIQAGISHLKENTLINNFAVLESTTANIFDIKFANTTSYSEQQMLAA